MENLFINHSIYAPSFILYLDAIKSYTIDTIKSLLNQDYNMYYNIILVYNNKLSNDLTEEETKEWKELLDNPIFTTIDTEHVKPKNISYIGDVCGYDGALKKSNKYAFIVYNGDIVDKNRLATQIDIMRKENCDVLLSAYTKNNKVYNFDDHYAKNKYVFSGMCIDVSKFAGQESIFEPYWEGSFFERFILHCDMHKKKIHLSNKPVTTVINRYNDEALDKWWNNKEEHINRLKNFNDNKQKENITIIIPFKNEGQEIEKTVASIRATSKNFINIILINDTSDDNYDYENIANLYGCQYHYNKENLGVAGSRDFAIFNLVKTKYFMILDGHMRFYDLDWDQTWLPFIYDHPKDITCTATIEIVKDKEFTYNEDGVDRIPTTAGSYFNNFPNWHCEWLNKYMYDDRYYVDTELKIMEVPIVLGACYSSSVEWWKHIGGLKFLKKYGNDEQLMSIKNYMFGGHNYYLKNFFTGHYYKIQKYQNTLAGVATEILYNNLMLTMLFLPKNFNIHLNQYKDNKNYDKLVKLIDDSKEEIEKYREELKNAPRTFDDYLAFHNEIAYKTNGKNILCIGYDSIVRYYIKMGYNVTVYEPDPKLYNKLKVDFNSDIVNKLMLLKNEVVVNNNKEYVPFYVNLNNENMSSIYNVVANNGEQLNVNVLNIYSKATTLKKILEQNKNKFDLVRIFTNYDEQNIIKSLRPTKKPKYIIMPTRPALDSKKTGKGLYLYGTLDYLYNIGYRKFCLTNTVHISVFGEEAFKKLKFVDYETCKKQINVHVSNFLKAGNKFTNYIDGLHATF